MWRDLRIFLFLVTAYMVVAVMLFNGVHNLIMEYLF